MPKIIFPLIIFVALFPAPALAQNDSLPAKYFSLGSKNAGICFGNSRVYTGVRFNLENNEHVKRVNILNVTVLNMADNMKSNGISLALMLSGQAQNNGISIASAMNYTRHQNGIMLSCITLADRLNGIGVGVVMFGDTLNGLTIGFLSGRNNIRDTTISGKVNGIAVGVVRTSFTEVKGVTISPYNSAKTHKGLVIGGFNKTAHLKGVQIGLYNVALNNPKGLRRLPLINIHFKKDKTS